MDKISKRKALFDHQDTPYVMTNRDINQLQWQDERIPGYLKPVTFEPQRLAKPVISINFEDMTLRDGVQIQQGGKIRTNKGVVTDPRLLENDPEYKLKVVQAQMRQ